MSLIDKIINILKLLAVEPFEYLPGEISRKTAVNRTSVYRILAGLEKEAFVIKGDGGKYSIGPALYHIGNLYFYKQNFYKQILSIIDDVALKTRLRVGLAILDHDTIINLYESDMTMNARISHQYGRIFPINAGVYGKTIMAFVSPPEKLRMLVYRTKLEQFTKHSITDPELLLKEYDAVRRQGFGVSVEELINGAIGFGAPVFNKRGEIYGAVGIAGARATMRESEYDNYVRLALATAKKVGSFVV